MGMRVIQRKPQLILTCEHATNRVPPELRKLFENNHQILETHRGYDLGALSLAKNLAKTFQIPLFTSTCTRLICDVNRSPNHPTLFSEFTRTLSHEKRERIIASYYLPHRSAVETCILRQVREGRPVIHIGVHTFTPNLDGVERKADIGLLYDPHRRLEKEFCRQWRHTLIQMTQGLSIRRNSPYRGESDGFPAFFRKIIPENAYIGIELEVNQKHFFLGKAVWKKTGQILADSLGAALGVDLFDTGESTRYCSS